MEVRAVRKFRTTLFKWYKNHKRVFPWRSTSDPYKILVAEILLQKTNVSKVITVYKQFIEKYPDASSLANAREVSVKYMIKDLGLTYRAERLITIGKHIENNRGTIPNNKNSLLNYKGIGRYIASATACFAFNQREPILDSNIIRLYERVFAFKSTNKRQRDDCTWWAFAESLLPTRKYKEYNYALLDFSALQCTAHNPNHDTCPVRATCNYYKSSYIKRKPIGIDIFSGAGGLSLGFEQAGFDIIYAVECDKHAAETYRKNRKKKRSLIVDARDIKDINPKTILKKIGIDRGDLDIVIGGPPCQGFSQSNMRTRNLANPQNQLIFKFIEFVNALYPKLFLMENVAGLISLDNGKLKDLLLEEFEAIGYTTKSLILNSVNFGVPQSRNRIFFIGSRVGSDMSVISNLVNKSTKKPITVKAAITDLPYLTNGNNNDELNYNDLKQKLSSFQRMMRKGMNDKVRNNLTTKHNDLAITRFENIGQGENLLSLAKRNPNIVSNYKNIKNCHHWIYMRLPLNKPSVALNNFRKNMLIHPTQNRGLSVREAARLQSFPDRYVFFGSIGFQQQQVSNAVPVLLAKYIAKILKEAL